MKNSVPIKLIAFSSLTALLLTTLSIVPKTNAHQQGAGQSSQSTPQQDQSLRTTQATQSQLPQSQPVQAQQSRTDGWPDFPTSQRLQSLPTAQNPKYYKIDGWPSLPTSQQTAPQQNEPLSPAQSNTTQSSAIQTQQGSVNQTDFSVNRSRAPGGGGSQNFQLSFNYQDLNSEDIRVELYPENSPNNILRGWEFDNVSGSGSKTIEWDKNKNLQQQGTNGKLTLKVYAPRNSNIEPRFVTFSATDITRNITPQTALVYAQNIQNATFISEPKITPNAYDPQTQKGSIVLTFQALNPPAIPLQVGVYDNNNNLISVWTNIHAVTGINRVDLTNSLMRLPSGNYTLKISGMDNDPRITAQFVQFTVKVPEVNISNLRATNVQSGRPTISFDVTNPGTSRLDVTIYNDRNRVMASWNNVRPKAGTNTLNWQNNVNYLVPGTYTLEIKGTDQFNRTINPQRISFTVDSGSISTQATQQKGTLSTQEQSSDQCAGYKDIKANDPHCEAVRWMKQQGIVTGNPDGTLAPRANLQRDQLLKIILEGKNLFSPNTDYCQGQKPFPDIDENDWSYQYVCLGKNLGIVRGYEAGPEKGKFIPYRPINHAEYLAMLLRTLKKDTLTTAAVDNTQQPWYNRYVTYARDKNLFPRPGRIPVGEPISRLEAIRVFHKLSTMGELGQFGRTSQTNSQPRVEKRSQ